MQRRAEHEDHFIRAQKVIAGLIKGLEAYGLHNEAWLSIDINTDLATWAPGLLREDEIAIRSSQRNK
jgi:hypothetical protein